MAEGDNLEGLEGWLVVIGFLVVVGPIFTILSLGGLLSETSPEGRLDRMLLVTIAVQLAFLLVQIYLIFLFFTKSRRFPTVFVILLVINLIASIAVALSFGRGSWGPLVGIVSTILQLSYILNSERV